MEPIQEGDHWVLARNVRTIYAGGMSGTRSRMANRSVTTYERWGTNGRWWGNKGGEMKFPTGENAEQYLAENYDSLDQAD